MSKELDPRYPGKKLKKVESIRSRIHEVEPLLELDEPFAAYEFGGDPNHKQLLSFLQKKNIIRQVGRTGHPNRNSHREVHTWEFQDGMRDAIEAKLDELNTLPCGHRSHIHHNEDGNLSCKFCQRNGENPEYSKQTVQESLEA